MKKFLCGVAALAASAVGAAAMAEDLEILDPQISQAFAQVLQEAVDKVEKAAVKVDCDIEKACGVHREQSVDHQPVVGQRPAERVLQRSIGRQLMRQPGGVAARAVLTGV